MIFLDPKLAQPLHDYLMKIGQFTAGSGDTVPIKYTGGRECRGARTPGQQVGILKYILKHLSPKALHEGVSIASILGIDDRSRKQQIIYKKRTGTSQSLGRKARAKSNYWKDATKPDDVAAILEGKYMPTKTIIPLN
ncbi:hypothetical protein ACLF3G_25060 [Falsiroseomonas sp. HC035]|uniref:hypothetical protein n=1 Tax=Falsiroseomonas sp. HC035 TaxID=3390999 RepID=UPI003D3184FF